MQIGVNVLVIEGGVVKDPELKYTRDGLAVATFSIANSGLGYKNGERTQEVSYFNVTAFGKLAEIASTYLKKGSRIIISGNLRQSRWKNQEGQNQYMVRIIAQDIKFLPSARRKPLQPPKSGS